MGPLYHRRFLRLSAAAPPDGREYERGLPPGWWDDAARLSLRLETSGLFEKNVRAIGAWGRLSPELRRTVEEENRAVSLRNAKRMRIFEHLADALGAAGVVFVPLKGASFFCRRVYPDFSHRKMSDLDILIQRESYPAADAVLRGAGFTLKDPLIRGVCVNPGQEAAYERDGEELDLHYRFFPWYEEAPVFGQSALDCFERSVPASWNGRAVRLLRPEDEFQYLMNCALRDRWRAVRYLVDLDAYARRNMRAEEWSQLRRRLDESRLRRKYGEIAAFLREELGSPVPDPMAGASGGGIGRRAAQAMEGRGPGPLRTGKGSDLAAFAGFTRGPMVPCRLVVLFFMWNAFKRFGWFRRFFACRNNPVPVMNGYPPKEDAPVSLKWNFNKNRFFSRELEGEHIIVDLKTGDYYTLDGAGGVMFGGILKGRSEDEIESAVSKTYRDAPQRSIRRDLKHLVRDLESKKIIQAA